MTSNSSIPRETIQAYLVAEYRVLSDPPFVLRVGEGSEALASLYGRLNVGSAAFLTAWNPGGELAPEEENEAAQRRLVGELEASGVRCLDGFGADPRGEWPGEQSCLALGMSLEAAKAMGARFGQNAVVWAGADAVPQLILLR